MAIPFAALASMPLLAGGGAAAGGAAAAGLGSTLAGAGLLAGGLGSVGSAIFGQGGGQSAAGLPNMFTQLAPVNQRLTFAGQELMANIAPYLGAEAGQTQLLGQTAYDIFSGAKSKEAQQVGVQTGLASLFGQAAVGAQELAAKGRTALELGAGETQRTLTEKGADVLGLQYTNLAKGIGDVGTNAANIRNQQVMAQTQANLNLKSQLLLKKADTEAMLAGRREARSALPGGFA